MEHVFAVKNQEELALYQAFLQDARPRLEEYIRFLQAEYRAEELPRCIVWSDPDIAVRLVSDIPVPAYTNDFREIYTAVHTLSLHDALSISWRRGGRSTSGSWTDRRRARL